MTSQQIISGVVCSRWKESYFCKYVTLIKLTKLLILTEEEHLLTFWFQLIKWQCCPHIETSQFIRTANQLTGFYMRATLALNRLSYLCLISDVSLVNWKSSTNQSMRRSLFEFIANSIVKVVNNQFFSTSSFIFFLPS